MSFVSFHEGSFEGRILCAFSLTGPLKKPLKEKGSTQKPTRIFFPFEAFLFFFPFKGYEKNPFFFKGCVLCAGKDP